MACGFSSRENMVVFSYLFTVILQSCSLHFGSLSGKEAQADNQLKSSSHGIYDEQKK